MLTFFMHSNGMECLSKCKEWNVTYECMKITVHNELKGGTHESLVNE
jgi:hypothetical protein